MTLASMSEKHSRRPTRNKLSTPTISVFVRQVGYLLPNKTPALIPWLIKAVNAHEKQNNKDGKGFKLLFSIYALTSLQQKRSIRTTVPGEMEQHQRDTPMQPFHHEEFCNFMADKCRYLSQSEWNDLEVINLGASFNNAANNQISNRGL